MSGKLPQARFGKVRSPRLGPRAFRRYDAVVLNSERSGLCNRLRGLVGAQVVSELCGVPFCLHWSPNWACPAHIDELFEPVGQRASYTERSLVIATGARAGVSPNAPSAAFHRLVRNRVRFDEFCSRCRDSARRLRPIPPLQRRIDSITGGWPKTPIIGVHVRRTDLLPRARRDTGVRLEDEPHFRRLDQLIEELPRCHFFLATDNPDSQARYLERYGSRILLGDTRFHPPSPQAPARVRLSSVGDAVVELYCLGRSDRVVGTWYSSFTDFAGMLCQGPHEHIR